MLWKTSKLHIKTLLQQFGSNSLWSLRRLKRVQLFTRERQVWIWGFAHFLQGRLSNNVWAYARAFAVWLTSFKRSRKLTGEMDMNVLSAPLSTWAVKPHWGWAHLTIACRWPRYSHLVGGLDEQSSLWTEERYRLMQPGVARAKKPLEWTGVCRNSSSNTSSSGHFSGRL